jgi:iron(III) transport system ATP-binding protein
MTVEQNVAFGLELRKLPREEIRRRVGEILDVVHMGHLAARYPAELSGGQQQRVALARAIVIQPQVLLLDEPLSNLDANLREEMRFEIRRLHDEFRITTVYVTHDQAEAMAISDRIAVMSHGQIKQIGKPREIYDSPEDPFTAEFIGLANFFPGKATSEKTVCLAGREELEIDGCRELNMGADVILSIRPHNIKIYKEVNKTRNELQGIVAKGAYLGDKVDYRVRVGDSILRIQTPPGEVFTEGTKVCLHLPAEKISVISAARA